MKSFYPIIDNDIFLILSYDISNHIFDNTIFTQPYAVIFFELDIRNWIADLFFLHGFFMRQKNPTNTRL